MSMPEYLFFAEDTLDKVAADVLVQEYGRYFGFNTYEQTYTEQGPYIGFSYAKS